MNEKTLIKQCQKGKRAAFEELIRLYYPYVSRFLVKICRNETLAEDLTQDTFLKMIKNIEKYDTGGSASFGTWLITIAKNCYIDYMRLNRIYLENIDDLQTDSGFDVAEKINTKMQYKELQRLIEELPPEQGLAIRLKYEEELTLEEIAALFGVQAKTIKSRIHDGTVKLRKRFNSTERKDSP